VKTLDLACKDGIDVDRDTKFGFEDIGKSSLVGLFDGSEGFSELGIVGHGQQVGEQLGIEQPLFTAEGMADERSELGVALEDPSARQLISEAWVI
jgi:hypothetical protein